MMNYRTPAGRRHLEVRLFEKVRIGVSDLPTEVLPADRRSAFTRFVYGITARHLTARTVPFDHDQYVDTLFALIARAPPGISMQALRAGVAEFTWLHVLLPADEDDVDLGERIHHPAVVAPRHLGEGLAGHSVDPAKRH